MNEQNTPTIFKAKPGSLKDLLGQPKYENSFRQVLGDRAPQFISSLLQVGASMQDVEPKSIIAAAATAAALDLPINKNLGFAHIVPYKRGGIKYGQFQMGYKGYIQLALRSGSYERMNARAINKEALKGYDEVGEPKVDWQAVDVSKPVHAYAFAFRQTNGFTKVCVWLKTEVEEHARRYSQAYKGGFDTPWKSNFDRMALKTVISNELRLWGQLTIQMQRALTDDQTVRVDVGEEAEYIDLETPEIVTPKFASDEKAESAAGLAPSAPAPAPAPPPGITGGSPANPTPAAENPREIFRRKLVEHGIAEEFIHYALAKELIRTAPPENEPDRLGVALAGIHGKTVNRLITEIETIMKWVAESRPPVSAPAIGEMSQPQKDLLTRIQEAGITVGQFLSWANETGQTDEATDLREVPDNRCLAILKAWDKIEAQIKLIPV